MTTMLTAKTKESQKLLKQLNNVEQQIKQQTIIKTKAEKQYLKEYNKLEKLHHKSSKIYIQFEKSCHK